MAGRRKAQYWQGVAADHYDTTGERITPDEAREMYEE